MFTLRITLYIESLMVPTLLTDSDHAIPPVNLIMTNFSDWRRRADHWFSPSFYSLSKYKMCVRVDANREEKGKRSYVSIYVHLMAGRYDDTLSWPFRGEVKLQIRNRCDNSDHIDFTIQFYNPRESSCNQIKNGIVTRTGIAATIGEGIDKLIPHEILLYNSVKETEYLRDDSLVICVKEVVPSAVSLPTSMPIQPASPTPVDREFIIHNFTTQETKLTSKPFYSHKNGYKFLLVVYPNGNDGYEGRSVSIYCHLMNDENDKNLQFPFRGKLTLQIVNHISKEDKNHCELPIVIDEQTDPDGKIGGRVKTLSLDNLIAGRSYNGYGLPNFIRKEFLSFNKIRNTQYISDNDELVIRVTNIDVYSK